MMCGKEAGLIVNLAVAVCAVYWIARGRFAVWPSSVARARVCVYVCVCMCACERERERERVCIIIIMDISMAHDS